MSRPSVLPGAAPAWWLQDADDGDRSAPLAADLDVDVFGVTGRHFHQPPLERLLILGDAVP